MRIPKNNAIPRAPSRPRLVMSSVSEREEGERVIYVDSPARVELGNAEDGEVPPVVERNGDVQLLRSVGFVKRIKYIFFKLWY